MVNENENENDNYNQKSFEGYSSFKKVTSDNTRNATPSLVPKLKIDLQTDYEENKANSQRKRKVIKMKKRGQGLIQGRRYSGKSNYSSLSNLSKTGSDGKLKQITEQ